MAKCIYCQDASGLLSQVCKDCRKLIAAYKTLGTSFGYRELLDSLLATEVDENKIERFLDADPDGSGSLNQQVTARMTNELMGAMGQESHMTANDVKDVEESVKRGESYLDMPDVVTHPKAEED